MNLRTFSEAIDLVCKAFPVPGQADRVSVLYKFYGEREYQRIVDTAERVARDYDRFPTPSAFEVFFRQTVRPTQLIDNHQDITLTDMQLSERIVENPERTYRGVLCFLGGDDSPENLAKRPVIFQRITKAAKEILGEAGCKRVRETWNPMFLAVGRELQGIEKKRARELSRLRGAA
jgi:hypothetical protein